MNTSQQTSHLTTPTQPKKNTRRQQFEQAIQQMNESKENAYTLLNIGKDYTLKELAKKYRKCALKYHPDRLIKHSEYITREQKKHCEEMFEKITKLFFLLKSFIKKTATNHFMNYENKVNKNMRNKRRNASIRKNKTW